MKKPRSEEDKNPSFTVTPFLVAAAKAASTLPTVESEFGRMGDLRRLFGITRSTAYVLVKKGLIKTVCLRHKGQARGVRLVSVPSVRAYLNSLLEQQSGEGETE